MVVTAFGRIKDRFAAGSKAAVGGALLAAMNTASEYGLGRHAHRARRHV
ncbi:hypothetical protein [Massilia sp. Leaf139]|nr:hypothetical protein [Massilia sp. Leaf139]